MTAKLLRQTKMAILLSLNAVAILIVGVMIFSAINLNGGIEFRVVSERSDTIGGSLEELGLVDPVTDKLDAQVVVSGGNAITLPNGGGGASGGASSEIHQGGSASNGGVSGGNVPRGQLWAEEAITIYQTADFDICVGGGLSGLGEMYWQSSNQSVISGFYNTARTWLGYNSETCRYPAIVGTGTTVITAGTYDGQRYDKITVTVIAPPVEQWKKRCAGSSESRKEEGWISGFDVGYDLRRSGEYTGARNYDELFTYASGWFKLVDSLPDSKYGGLEWRELECWKCGSFAGNRSGILDGISRP